MIKGFAKAVQELIYPHYCLLCHKRIPQIESKELVCGACLETITLNTPPFCQKCGRKIKGPNITKNICADCRRRHFEFDRAWASCSYEGKVKEMLHSFKYKNKITLKKPLSRLLIEFTERYYLPVNHCDHIVPMPLSRRKLREREFNQSELLTENFSRHFGLEILKDNLVRLRDTCPQAGLNKNERLDNVRGAFGIREPAVIKDKVILLFDDVLTTGSTASEAAKALKGSGARVVFVLTLAN